MYSTIIYKEENHIATITLNRTERKNAISPDMVNELLYAFEAAFQATHVRVVVLAANGKIFSSGGDLGQMPGSSDAVLPPKGDYSDLLLTLTRAPKPVVAKVQGHAMGGGLGLIAASTFAIASSEAQLGTPEVNVGLFPMMIMAILVRTMPRKALLEMMLFGQKLIAEDALKYGLINRVVPSEKLDNEVTVFTEQLCQKSPTAIARGLAAFSKMEEKSLEQALPWLRDELYSLIGTEDAREGLLAFMEKRTPRWTGR